MPSTPSLETHLDPATAAAARLEAERCGISLETWIAAVLRRELRYTGEADALAAKTYEVVVASAHLLHALMLESIGPEATARAVEQAMRAAKEETAAELARAAEVDP